MKPLVTISAGVLLLVFGVTLLMGGCTQKLPDPPNAAQGSTYVEVDGYRYERVVTPRTLTYFYVDETGAHSRTWKMMSKTSPNGDSAAFVESGGTVVIVSGQYIIEKDPS